MRFTYRQQEFARLYAAGFPAARAASYAGYARSTVETNAARLLAHPAVQNLVNTLRNQNAPSDLEDLHAERTRLIHMVRYCQDDKMALMALRELRLRRTAKPNPNAPLPTHLAEQYMPVQIPDPNTLQVALMSEECVEDEQVTLTPTAQLAIPEQDELPDGRPAPDQTLRPLKPLPPSTHADIPVQFFPTQGDFDPTPDPELSNI